MPGEELRSGSSPTQTQQMLSPIDLANDGGEAWVWIQIKAEARRDAETEPALASYLYSTILSHPSLERSLSFHLGNKLCSSTLLSTLLYDLFLNSFSRDPNLRSATVADLIAARYRDPACVSFSHCLLNYKGFLACQVANMLFDLERQRDMLVFSVGMMDVVGSLSFEAFCLEYNKQHKLAWLFAFCVNLIPDGGA